MSGPVCYKRCYPTQYEANLALLHAWAALTRGHNERRREIRAYYHEGCQSWHLTSHPAPPEKHGHRGRSP